MASNIPLPAHPNRPCMEWLSHPCRRPETGSFEKHTGGVGARAGWFVYKDGRALASPAEEQQRGLGSEVALELVRLFRRVP